MWNQAASNHMRLLDLTQYGWKIVDGKPECDWESVGNRGSETTSGPTVSRLLMFLHVVHDDAVVSSRATSVVPVVGVRTVVILPVPQVHSNRAQMS